MRVRVFAVWIGTVAVGRGGCAIFTGGLCFVAYQVCAEGVVRRVSRVRAANGKAILGGVGGFTDFLTG